MEAIAKFAHALHQLQLIRRIAFFWMMFITSSAFYWAIDYATTLGAAATSQTAMIIGAILTPTMTLQGAVINFYAKHKYEVEFEPPVKPDGSKPVL